MAQQEQLLLAHPEVFSLPQAIIDIAQEPYTDGPLLVKDILAAGQQPRLEIGPLRTRRQGLPIDRPRYRAPAMPRQDLRGKAGPLRPAAKKCAVGIAHFLRRVDDDVPELAHAVGDKRRREHPGDRAPG